MHIHKLGNGNVPSTGFQGRVQMPPEQFFIKMINGIDVFGNKQKKIVKDIIKEEQWNKPFSEKTFIQKLRKAFSFKNPVSKKAMPEKTLNDFWKESLDKMKNLVIEKLPDDYVLRVRKSNLSPDSMSFKITRGKEYVYSASAFISNPKFPQERISEAVDIISRPDYQKNLNDFKEIIPDLTENKFVMHNEKFLTPKMLKWIDVNKKLKQEASAKNLKVEIQLQYSRVQGIIKEQNDKLVGHSTFILGSSNGIDESFCRYNFRIHV